MSEQIKLVNNDGRKDLRQLDKELEITHNHLTSLFMMFNIKADTITADNLTKGIDDFVGKQIEISNLKFKEYEVQRVIERLDKLEGNFASLDKKVASLDEKVASLDKKVANISEGVEKRLVDFEHKIDKKLWIYLTIFLLLSVMSLSEQSVAWKLITQIVALIK